MITGSCLCGEVVYQFDQQPFDCCYCHCTICQKLSGSSGGAYGSVRKADFNWNKGQNNLLQYKPTSASKRYFCSTCATFLLTEHDSEKLNVFVSLGTLDSQIETSPGYHQYVKSLPNWCSVTDDLPCYNAWPTEG